MERVERIKKRLMELKPPVGSENYVRKYNCAEAMIRVYNEEYSIGMDENTLRMFCAFGGGMYAGLSCGYYIASCAILGHLYSSSNVPYVNQDLKKILANWSVRFREKFTVINCSDLKVVNGTCEDLGLLVVEEFERYLEEFSS